MKELEQKIRKHCPELQQSPEVHKFINDLID